MKKLQTITKFHIKKINALKRKEIEKLKEKNKNAQENSLFNQPSEICLEKHKRSNKHKSTELVLSNDDIVELQQELDLINEMKYEELLNEKEILNFKEEIDKILCDDNDFSTIHPNEEIINETETKENGMKEIKDDESENGFSEDYDYQQRELDLMLEDVGEYNLETSNDNAVKPNRLNEEKMEEDMPEEKQIESNRVIKKVIDKKDNKKAEVSKPKNKKSINTNSSQKKSKGKTLIQQLNDLKRKKFYDND